VGLSKHVTCAEGSLRLSTLLSVSDKEPEETAHGPSGETSGRGTRALRVLVVEDNPVNQAFTTAILSNAGHSCDVAENGAKAVAAVQATVYDIVLMDIHMPEMDGLEATRRIRRLDGPVSRIPIIALTADVVAGQRDDFDTVGMDGYIIKPLDPKILLSTIDGTACKSRTENELEIRTTRAPQS
jgi:two-component system sensor histidine kinase/response regulator